MLPGGRAAPGESPGLVGSGATVPVFRPGRGNQQFARAGEGGARPRPPGAPLARVNPAHFPRHRPAAPAGERQGRIYGAGTVHHDAHQCRFADSRPE